MRLRPTAVLALAALVAAAPGCSVYYGVTRLTGLRGPPKFAVRDQIPTDFRMGVSIQDFEDPPVDCVLTFDRSGKATYDVTVRLPRRKHDAGTFEISEAQVVSLWKAVAAAKFDELDDRYPGSGDGKDRSQGVQKYYVYADGVDHKVETHMTAMAEIDKIRDAVVAVVPPDVMKAAGVGGDPGDAPKEYIGDTSTMVFHLPECALLKDVPAERRQPFTTRYDALDRQYHPCPECHPLRTK